MDPPTSFFVQAEYAFTSPDGSALSFRRGDVIEVLTQLDSGWWDGLLVGGERGWFPSNYVRRISDEEAEEWFLRHEKGIMGDAELEGVQDGERMAEDEGNGRLFYHPGVDDDGLYDPDPPRRTSTVPAPNTRPISQQIVPSGPADRQSAVDNSPNPSQDSVDVADFWIPSMTDDGQIYYHNTKTGENAWEMPTLEMNSEDAVHPTAYDPTEHLQDDYSPPARAAGGDPGLERTKRMDSDNDLAGIAAPTTGIPTLGPPWELRMRSNNAGWYYFNTVTGDVKTDRALLQQRDGPSAGTTGMTRTVSEPHALNIRITPHTQSSPRSATPTPSTSASRRPSTAGSASGSTSKSRGVLDIAEDALRVFGIKNKGRRASKASLFERTPQGTTSAYHTKHVNAAIGADSAGDGWMRGKRGSAGSIHGRSSSRWSSSATTTAPGTQGPQGFKQGNGRGADDTGLFWSGRGPEDDTLAQERRLAERVERDRTTVRGYVEGIQRQLDAAVQAAEQHLLALQTPDETLTSLSLPDTPPAGSAVEGANVPVSQMSSARLLRTHVAALVPLVRELVYSTRHAVLGLDHTILETLPPATQPTSTTAQHALAFLSPEELHHPQRRLVAALSKIIFFTHSAAGADWPLGGTAERLALDTRDLGNAVRTYVDEVGRVGCLSEQRGKGVKRGPVASFAGLGMDTKEGEAQWPAVQTPSHEWKVLDDSAVDALQALVAEAQRSTEGATLEASQSLVDQTDKVFRFLRDLDMLAVLDIDNEISPEAMEVAGWEAYFSTVVEARNRFVEYSAAVRRAQGFAGDLLLHVVDRDDLPLADTVGDLGLALKAVSSSVSSLCNIAKSQAELVPFDLSGRIGAQSSSEAEKRQRFQRMGPSSSTRSSLTSAISVRDRPATRYYPSGPNDPRGFPTSRSQTSLLAHSISRTGSMTAGSRISASSSVTSLSQNDEHYNHNYSRNSVGAYGKSGLFADSKRSTSINKKKLAKMLGEEEFGEMLSTHISRPVPDEKPFYLNVDYAEDDIIINPNGSVKAGTLPALVERLTLHESMDPTFNSTFLMTYRSFATAEEVLNLLIKRYQLQPPPNLTPDQLSDWAERKQKPVKLRVFNVLKTWLDQHYNENMDADILEGISEFATDIMAKDTQVRMPSQQLLKAVQRRQSDGDILLRRMTTTLSNAPPPLIPKVGAGKSLQLADINPVELARQMTLMEFQLYNRIRPVDCLNKAWSQTDRPEAGANIKAMILTSNRIAGWVAEAILIHTDAKKRASVMKHFVSTAEHCRLMNNFSTMAAIMAGLNSTPIRRLHRTRQLLSAKTLALLDDLDKTLDSGKNFAGYRERLKRVDPPCIPFLGVYLTFLTFIEDGNANFLPAASSTMASSTPSTSASTLSLNQQAQESSSQKTLATDETAVSDRRLLIHFSKRQKAADVIREIQQYQAIPYALTAQPAVQTFISERLHSAEDGPDLYEISLQLEPREREDEKIARMLRESGMI